MDIARTIYRRNVSPKYCKEGNRTMSTKLERLARLSGKALPLLIAIALTEGVAWAQFNCMDNTTWFYAQSLATRLNGNTVRLYSSTTDGGNYWNWWALYIATTWYFNGN